MSEYDTEYYGWGSNKDTPTIESMLGKTFSSVRTTSDNNRIIFENEDEVYIFTHFQDCCESVVIEDIVGDLTDLENSPLFEAEEVSNSDGDPPSQYSEAWVWTYYKFGTIKGHVNIRWLGESNGYYSMDVDLVYKKKEK